MFYYKFILVIVIFININVVYTQDSCTSRTTCRDCITDPSVCVWCAMDDFNGTRCIAKSTHTLNWCPEYVQDSKNEQFASENRNFSYTSDHVVQIKPQLYTMKLRPGKAETFNFTFKAAPNFPVDIYFLLDASLTMAKVKNITAEQSENIYKTIKNMTENVYLGFGTFVDKRAVPYTSFSQNDIDSIYSFRHRLSMSDNFTKFQETVIQTPNCENRDDQEGGLDALAQVMVCKDLIGWRNESRKIIVFLTNGPYHAAGDGRTAGIFQPYDGQCYTYDEAYTKELEMDYPSVGMINKLAVDRQMIILFYVQKNVKDVYKRLSDVIDGSKVSMYRNAKKTDTGIVNILKEIYEKISKKITFKVNVKSGQQKKVEVIIKPDCTSEDSGSECDIEIGKEKHFEGNVKLLGYSGQDKVVADLVIESIGEKLTLDIDVIKNCACENDDKVEKNATVCHGRNRICGICDCGERRYGKMCVCERSDNNNVFNGESTCIPKISNELCSGQGLCECGSCKCNDGFSGTFCECNRNNCPRNGELVCSGETHGDCWCGKCKCKDGWKGDACECRNHDCKVDGTVCSNRGHCGCNGCECDDIAPWDARNQYDKSNCKMIPSPESHSLQCGNLETCALCTRDNSDECMLCDERINPSVIQTLTEEYLNSSAWNVCYAKVDVGCYTTFAYVYDDKHYNILLIVQQDKNCAESFYIFGGVFLVTLVLVGLATLVGWKLLTDARDRLEYLQFLKKVEETENKNVNPLYRPPTTKFGNPNFRKLSFNYR